MSRPKIGDLIPIGGGGYSLLSNITDFKASRESENSVRLYWRDPDDVIVDGVTITSWKGTQIRRKEGNYPVNEKDGELVVDSKIRNQYSTTPFVDTGLDKDTEYYYMAFPYTDKNVFTVDSANRVVLLPTVFYYSHGDEKIEITGGWTYRWIPSNKGDSKSYTTGTKEEDHMYLSMYWGSGGGSAGASVFESQNKINLNGLNKIVVSWEGVINRFDIGAGADYVIGVKETKLPAYGKTGALLDAQAVYTPGSGNIDFELRENFLDVSNLNGEYYLYIIARAHVTGKDGAIKIYEIRGEV